MPFLQVWDESAPAGSAVASGIDTYIQIDKIATRERLESLLGIVNFSARFPMSADALKMSGAADSYIIGGTASWGVKNNLASAYNIQLSDAGVLTIRAGLIVTAGGVTVTAGTTTTKDLQVTGGQGRLTEYDAGNLTGAKTIDFNNGNNQLGTLTGNTTLTLSNPAIGCWYQFRFVQGGAGSYTVTWPATVKWQSGVAAPTLTTTVGRTDVIALFYNGTNYLGTIVGLNWNA